MDNINSLSTFLKSQKAIVKLTTATPTFSGVNLWEKNNNQSLPDDLKLFYKQCDGFNLTWSALGIDQVGNVNISCIKDLKKVVLNMKEMFLLSSAGSFGDVYLVFNTHQPQVYFYRSDTDSFSFLAPSFAAYFRLMVLNLGIIGWQMAYTFHPSRPESGLPPQVMDLLTYFAPGSTLF